jgi:hypothetical protein
MEFKHEPPGKMQMHARKTLLFGDELDPPVILEEPTRHALRKIPFPPVLDGTFGDVAPSPEPGMVQVLCCDAVGLPVWLTVPEEHLAMVQGILRTVAHVDALYREFLPLCDPVPIIIRHRKPTLYNYHISQTLKRLNGTDVPRPARMKIACDEYRAFRAKQKEDRIAACGNPGLSTCLAAMAASPSFFDPGGGR